MNLRYFAEELLALCDEADQLRAENYKLTGEVEALRKDQYEGILAGQRTAAAWLAFVMDDRVKIDSTAVKASDAHS